MVGLRAFTAEGSVPGWGTKTLQAVWPKQQTTLTLKFKIVFCGLWFKGKSTLHTIYVNFIMLYIVSLQLLLELS